MAGHPRDSLLAVPETATGFRGSFQAPMTIDAAAESKMNADLYKAAMLKMCLRDPTYLAGAGPMQLHGAANANGAGNGAGNGVPKPPPGGWGYRILDDAEQAAFCERLTVEVFAPREEIVIQGQQHNQNFFIVTQGSVDLVVYHRAEKHINDYKPGGAPCRTLLEQPAPESDTVKRTVLCSKKPGDFFGLHMLLGDPAVHSAIAGDNGVVCLKLTRANKDLFGKEYKATDTKLFAYFGKGFDRTISQLKFLKGLEADPRFLLFHVGFRLTTMDRDGVLFEPNRLEKDRGALQVLLEGAVNVLFRPIGQPIGTADKLIPVKKGQLFGEVGLGLWLPRNAGAIASSRCYFLELSQSDFRKFCEIVPEALALFQVRLDEYKVPFDLWSESPMFVDRFVQLVGESKSAQNQQNYDFWRACRAFRVSRVDDPKTVQREANDLLSAYLSPTAAPNKRPTVKDATVAAVSAAVAKGANRLSLYPAEKEAVASLAPLWGKTPALAATCKRMLWEMFNDPISVAAPIKALNTGCNNPKCIAATTQLQQQLRAAEDRAKAAQEAVDDATDKIKELQALLALKK